MIEVLKRYFEINLNDYDNIGVSLEINKAVAIASIAFMVAVIFFCLHRGAIRLVIMQLTRHGATSPEEAKTLKELGLDKRRFVKRILSGDNILTKTVARVGKKQYDYDEYLALSKKEKREIDKIDFEKEAFYIREEKRDLVSNIIDKYVTSVPRTITLCVFIALVTMAVIICMPNILSILDNILKSVKK